MGLPESAVAFLHKNAKRLHPCEHCNRDSGPVCREIGRTGMFDDLEILEYELNDGRSATEFVQEEIWSSGPMIWMGLRISDGTEFRWSEEEISE